MRKWAYLKKPYFANDKDMVYKIMIHEMKDYTLVYLYCSRDAVMSSFDLHYYDLEDALENWQDEIDAEGWHIIEDPLPNCQHDCIELVRVKERNVGSPEWEKGIFDSIKNGTEYERM